MKLISVLYWICVLTAKNGCGIVIISSIVSFPEFSGEKINLVFGLYDTVSSASLSDIFTFSFHSLYKKMRVI